MRAPPRSIRSSIRSASRWTAPGWSFTIARVTTRCLAPRLDIVDQPVKSSRRVTLTIDPSDVALDWQSGRWVGTIDVVFARLAKDGRDLGSTTETMRMNFDDQLYERLRKQGFLIVRTLEPAAAFARLRIVVYDRTSGRLGSLELPMKD